jgi:hypothetical protein
MQQPRKLKDLFETLLVIGAILLIPLFFAMRSQAAQKANDATATAEIGGLAATETAQALAYPTATPLGLNAGKAASPTAAPPTAAPAVAAGKQPPACTFPLANITVTESKPENYTFSKPQVVLTAKPGSPYEIFEWLPDNQQILMGEDLRDNLKPGQPAQQSIQLYNPETGEVKVYATRTFTTESPFWQPDLNAVVYPAMNFLGSDKTTYHPIFTRQLWVSYGDPKTAQMLVDNMSQFPIVAKPGGSEMLYFSDKKVSKLGQSFNKSSPTFFDPAQWDYGKGPRNTEPISYNLAWQPNTSLVFLYSNGAGLKMGGYTFILNTDTGQVCELDFDGWARTARWNSDGRYLAIIRATKYSVPVDKLDLTVLDTITGKLYTVGVIPQDFVGEHYLYGFTWAPDNYHLLAVGSASLHQNNQNGSDLYELYLVDFLSGQSMSALPEYSQSFSGSLAWSPDGSKLVISCPMNGIDRVCFIHAQGTGN